MRPISEVTQGLEQIEGALTDISPEEGSQGDDPAVTRYVLHRGENGQWADAPQATLDRSDDDSTGPRDLDPVFELGAAADKKIAALGRSSSESIRRAIELKGMDALGWYSSFHVRGVQWGAHVSLLGMAHMTTHVFDRLSVNTDVKLRLAFQAILQHELFHFATDYAVAQAELSQQQAWWVQAKSNRRIRAAGYLFQEEELANAWMLKSFRTALPQFRVRGKQEALKAFVKQSPPGYRDGLLIRTHSDWIEGLHDLAYAYADDAAVQDDNPRLWGRSGYDWAATYPMWPRINWRYCPIHLIDDTRRFGMPSGWLTFFTFARNVVEHPNFLKSLNKLTPALQRAWTMAKRRLQDGITPGMDFKRWPSGGEDVYSLRLNDNVRVHMRRERDREGWLAIEVGSHRALGHG